VCVCVREIKLPYLTNKYLGAGGVAQGWHTYLARAVHLLRHHTHRCRKSR
jgi:hypothetical protein